MPRLCAVSEHRLDYLLESAEDVVDVTRRLQRGLAVIPLIETAVGLSRLPAILPAPHLCFVAFGSIR